MLLWVSSVACVTLIAPTLGDPTSVLDPFGAPLQVHGLLLLLLLFNAKAIQ